MGASTRTITVLYHLAQAIEGLDDLTPSEFGELMSSPLVQNLSPAAERTLTRLFNLGSKSDPYARKKNDSPFDPFKFDTVMNRLRSTVLSHSSERDAAAEIEWLLRILLTSPRVFESVREVDNFLTNMTGVEHQTKSTGRDRIVDWYLKAISNMPPDEQNRIYHKMAKYIFINLPSNYKEWKELLYGEVRKS